ncbi:MAG: DUF2085 domain-containing protein [Thermoplasmatota archaeon]
MEKMKEHTSMKRSEMTTKDLGLKVIDDRHWLYRRTCHGDPSRSFWWRGRPMPLCSRCTAFYPMVPLGLLIGIFLTFFFDPPSWLALLVFSILEGPLVIDGLSQYQGMRSSNNLIRAITGAMAGAGIGGGIAFMAVWIAG